MQQCSIKTAKRNACPKIACQMPACPALFCLCAFSCPALPCFSNASKMPCLPCLPACPACPVSFSACLPKFHLQAGRKMGQGKKGQRGKDAEMFFFFLFPFHSFSFLSCGVLSFLPFDIWMRRMSLLVYKSVAKETCSRDIVRDMLSYEFI